MRVISSDEERADWVPGIGGAGLGFGDEDSVCDVSEADGLEFLQAGGCTVSAAAHTLAAHVSRTLVQGVTEGDGTASSSSSSSAATDALDLFRALRDPENVPDVPSPVSFFFYLCKGNLTDGSCVLFTGVRVRVRQRLRVPGRAVVRGVRY